MILSSCAARVSRPEPGAEDSGIGSSFFLPPPKRLFRNPPPEPSDLGEEAGADDEEPPDKLSRKDVPPAIPLVEPLPLEEVCQGGFVLEPKGDGEEVGWDAREPPDKLSRNDVPPAIPPVPRPLLEEVCQGFFVGALAPPPPKLSRKDVPPATPPDEPLLVGADEGAFAQKKPPAPPFLSLFSLTSYMYDDTTLPPPVSATGRVDLAPSVT